MERIGKQTTGFYGEGEEQSTQPGKLRRGGGGQGPGGSGRCVVVGRETMSYGEVFSSEEWSMSNQ